MGSKVQELEESEEEAAAEEVGVSGRQFFRV